MGILGGNPYIPGSIAAVKDVMRPEDHVEIIVNEEVGHYFYTMRVYVNHSLVLKICSDHFYDDDINSYKMIRALLNARWHTHLVKCYHFNPREVWV